MIPSNILGSFGGTQLLRPQSYPVNQGSTPSLNMTNVQHPVDGTLGQGLPAYQSGPVKSFPTGAPPIGAPVQPPSGNPYLGPTGGNPGNPYLGPGGAYGGKGAYNGQPMFPSANGYYPNMGMAYPQYPQLGYQPYQPPLFGGMFNQMTQMEAGPQYQPNMWPSLGAPSQQPYTRIGSGMPYKVGLPPQTPAGASATGATAPAQNPSWQSLAGPYSAMGA